MGTISESSRGPQSVRESISVAEVSPDRKHRLPITHRGPHEKGILATYSDAAAVEPYGRPDLNLNFESVINRLLSNSSYMPKAHDARLRKKALPILTGCTNTWYQYFARLVHQIRIKCASYHTKIKYTSIET